MIILFQAGQFGNQIFEYAALKSRFKNEKLIILGFDPLLEVMDGIEAIAFLTYNKKWKRVFFYLLRSFFGFLSERLHLFSWITEKNLDIIYHKGLIKNIIICRHCFFQNELYISKKAIDALHIKSKWVMEATRILERIPGKTNQRKIFLHIRRGDYVYFRPLGNMPGVLPLKWYIKAIKFMRKKYNNPIFIIITNDTPYAEDFFGSDENFIILEKSFCVDFALMSLCSDGILSASSFSWWGAYFAKEKSEGCFIAPKYWCEHGSKKWHPEGIQTSWITYFDVD